eukprot:gene14483-16033_t
MKLIDKEFYHIPNVAPDSRIPDFAERYVVKFDRFTAQLPKGIESVLAFQQCKLFVEDFYRNHPSSNSDAPVVILDSGCGKGSSTLEIARRHPEYPVIGVERSHVRLSCNKHYKPIPQQLTINEGRRTRKESLLIEEEKDEQETSDSAKEDEIINSFETLPNALLVRAELASFWYLVVKESNWIVKKHYLLHPNPAPKPGIIKTRFHASPSLPFFPLLGGSLIVRSNWRTYCEETLLAIQSLRSVCAALVPENTIEDCQVMDLENPVLYSHFDRKYAEVGVPMYEINIPLRELNKPQRALILQVMTDLANSQNKMKEIE